MSVHLEPYRRGGNQVLVADDVALRIGDRVQFHEARRGGSYLSSHDPRFYFGLGK